jgi:hypothetical protein
MASHCDGGNHDWVPGFTRNFEAMTSSSDICLVSGDFEALRRTRGARRSGGQRKRIQSASYLASN